MSEREVVAKFFEAYPQWKADANISFLIEKSEKPLSVENLAVAARVLRDTLLLAPEYEDKWQDHVFYNPSETGSAFRAQFIEQLRGKEQQQAATKEYESLVKQLGEKFRGQSLERLREVAEKRRVHSLTASQFFAERASTPREYRPYPEFPTLPEYLTLPGDIQATKIDAAFLNTLVRSDYYLYRRLYTKFGSQQLTDRQNGIMKGAAQPQGE